MGAQDWDEHYAEDHLPWDNGVPDPYLVEAVGRLPKGRALDIGCGTGTNAVFLASLGYEVVGIDFAPRALVRARVRAAEAGVSVAFHEADILTDPIPGGPYHLVFDRGCLHVFDDAADRERFAARVALLLAPGGSWLCLAGSTEGPPRGMGPPRRSARDLVAAVEPHLEILELRSGSFDVAGSTLAAWLCISGRRSAPAQVSSRH